MIVARLAMALIPLAAWAQDLSFDNSPNSDQVKEYLTKKKSDLAGAADKFVEEGRTWNVDPRLIMAIAGAETTFAKHLCGKNNAWNWFHKKTCKPSEFATFEEGIQTVTKWMRRSYIQRGYNTIPMIRTRYCAEGCDNWVKLVTLFHDEIPAGSSSAPVLTPVPPKPTAAPRPTPSPTPAATPTPSTPSATPHPLGLPLFVYFFAGAIVVGLWIQQLWKTGR